MKTLARASNSESSLLELIQSLISLDAVLQNTQLVRDAAEAVSNRESAVLQIGQFCGGSPFQIATAASGTSPEELAIHRARADGFAALNTWRQPIEEHIIEPAIQIAKRVQELSAAGALDNIEDVVNPGANSLRVGLDVCMRRVERGANGLATALEMPGALLTDLADSLDSARQELITLEDQIVAASAIASKQPVRKVQTASGQLASEALPEGCRSAAWYVQAVREFRTKGSKAEITTTQLRRAAMGGEIREFAHSRMGGRKRYHYLIIEVCKSPTFSSFAALLQKADTEGFVAKGRRGTKQRKPRLRESPSPD